MVKGDTLRGAKVRAAKKLADVMARLDRAIQEQKTHIFQYGLDGRSEPGHNKTVFAKEIAHSL